MGPDLFQKRLPLVVQRSRLSIQIIALPKDKPANQSVAMDLDEKINKPS